MIENRSSVSWVVYTQGDSDVISIHIYAYCNV